MRKKGVIQTLGPIQKTIVQQGVEYFLAIKDLAIAATKLWWKTSNRNVQDREPFNYENFKLVVDRLVTYSNLILGEVCTG